MYQNLASLVMNQPGRTGADKASDIMAFTKALVLPSQIYGLDNGTIASNQCFLLSKSYVCKTNY